MGLTSTEISLLATTVGAAIGEAIGIAPAVAITLTGDLASVVTAATEAVPVAQKIEGAVSALSTTLSDASAALPENATLKFANSVIGEFASAKSSYEAGQAVVIASPTVDGKAGLIVLVAKGGAAAEALGV